MKAQIRVAAAVAALVTCTVFAAPSQAASPRVPSIVVPLSGVNFDKEAEVKALYRRLQVASFDVCKSVVGPMVTIELGRCAKNLLDAAVAEANRPALTALHGPRALELSARR